MDRRRYELDKPVLQMLEHACKNIVSPYNRPVIDDPDKKATRLYNLFNRIGLDDGFHVPGVVEVSKRIGPFRDVCVAFHKASTYRDTVLAAFGSEGRLAQPGTLIDRLNKAVEGGVMAARDRDAVAAFLQRTP